MSKVYVGVDVAKEKLWVAVPGVTVRVFAHTARGQSSLVRWLRRTAGAEVQVCMEATGIYSRRLALRLLREPGVVVSIINPAQIRAYRQVLLRRTKTDAEDAEVILAYAESQHPGYWQPGSVSQERLAALVKQADRLRGQLVQSRSRREHADGLPALVRRTERAVQRCLQEQLASLDREIERQCAADPHLATHVAVLCTIPGIGRLSATQLLSYGGNALHERSAKALTAHAGLAPEHRLSGSSVRGRSHLNKQGDRRLRTALYMPALVATRCNPCIKSLYQRLLAAGKAKKLALAACMRKLLIIVRAILRTNRPFDPQFALT